MRRATFNGEVYISQEICIYYKTKAEAKKAAKKKRKRGTRVIVDKRKKGYFLWYGGMTKRTGGI